MKRYFSSVSQEYNKTRGNTSDCSIKESCAKVNLDDLSADPGIRPDIQSYHRNDRDDVRRAYLLKGPCQPQHHEFPWTMFGSSKRRFIQARFNDYSEWLEYSISKDAAYWSCCYLFKQDLGGQSGGDSFVGEGFKNWKRKERIAIHVGGLISSYNVAVAKCYALMNENQHVRTVINRHSDQVRTEYKMRLMASVKCVRHLLKYALSFRGHDEIIESKRPGNYIGLLRFLVDSNAEIDAVILRNAPQNNMLIAPDIQKDNVSVCALETIKLILNKLGDSLFSILIDESRDISFKEQLAVVIRYVNEKGIIVERFLGLEHVANTNASTLKDAIDALFSRYGLNISKLRGQGYDGASNMQGEFNGPKALILRENPNAYYLHCFAYQLQLALVSLAKNIHEIADLFSYCNKVLNIVGSSSKRRDLLREKQAEKMIEALELGEISTGQGLNQETNLQRSGDTRWGSHYNTLLSLHNMFDAIVDVLEVIGNDSALSADQKSEARGLVECLTTFPFVFCLILMKKLLGITNELSQSLQRKDQDIVNAMHLVKLVKRQLQSVRDNRWDYLLDDASTFCVKHGIEMPNMDDMFVNRGRRRCKAENTNLHHYRVEVFFISVDRLLYELDSRFTESTTELLICLACLSPTNLFSKFDKRKLLRLAEFYLMDFLAFDISRLDQQLENYIFDMCDKDSREFSQLNGISELAVTMVETGRHKIYPLVYKILTLALILPVAIATVERAFSAMSIIKNQLCNWMGDEWLSDTSVCYIEDEIFDQVNNESIMQGFQNMRTHRGQL